jgi:hypothetical protein
VPVRRLGLASIVLWTAVASTAATAAPRRVLLVDTSPLTTDLDLRRQLVEGLGTALETDPRLEARRYVPREQPGGVGIGELMERAKAHSEQFEEQKAVDVLALAERVFRRSFGAHVTVEPLIRVLLARAKLHGDLGRSAEAERDLSRVAVLDPERTLDPGVFPPPLVNSFKRLKAKLGASSGTLKVTTFPGGHPVWVDGRQRGGSPLLLTLPAGEHFVVAGPPGATFGRATTVTAGGSTKVAIRVDLPEPLTDDQLRALGREADAAWVLGISVVQRGSRHQIRARALSLRAVEPPRSLRSASVEQARLTWANSQLALRLRAALGDKRRPGAGAAPPPEPRRSSVLKSWWFWTLVVAVVGGGTAAAVVLTRDRDPGVRVFVDR